MNNSFFLAIAAALVAAPLTLAHDPAGTPKNYCEDPSEMRTHDYGAAASGFPYGFVWDGNTQDCSGDTVPGDYDGHNEFGAGRALLSVDNGDGMTEGSIVCVGEVAHHPVFGPIYLFDLALSVFLPFYVAADHISVVPPTDPGAPNCGDFEVDETSLCYSPCVVTFRPGPDGAYYVFLGDVLTGTVGTVGHVFAY